VIPTADLLDRGEGRVCVLQWRSYGRLAEFAGEVATVDCFEDNVLVSERSHEPGRGRVLVVDGHGSLACALVGDNIAGRALANGWAGIVVNGAVRDVAGLGELQLGVLALGSNPLRCNRRGTGTMGETVRFGGAEFEPGAFLVADRDGIVVCPAEPT
jgi:regulator of ribonuclease activity A